MCGSYISEVLSPQSTGSLRSLPGTKSPVLLSPSKEYSMEVVIGTKQGVPSTTKPYREVAEPIPQPIVTDKAPTEKAKEITHHDDFENFMNQIKEMKERRQKERERMEHLRPKNRYDEDISFKKPDIDEEEFPWESHYQVPYV
ncbi:unnamed protein product [Gongylonema pulchrum]|uniref:CDI domain-containing protein n=1 Tax=Gongylonema pulchrum TaxID=637853 RepID=A0A183D8J6_9BILA|nr:unnamed protein product [Gongylonema pulchrum]